MQVSYKKAWTAMVLSTLCFCWLCGCQAVQKDKPIADEATKAFHARLDNGDLDAIYNDAAPEFKQATSKKDFDELFQAIHRKLGKVKTTEGHGWNVNTETSATIVVLNFNTEFEGGKGTETFTWRVNDRKASLVSYNVNSNALVVK